MVPILRFGSLAAPAERLSTVSSPFLSLNYFYRQMKWTILWPTNLFFQFLLIPSFSAVFEEILKNSSFYLDPNEQHCAMVTCASDRVALAPPAGGYLHRWYKPLAISVKLRQLLRCRQRQ